MTIRPSQPNLSLDLQEELLKVASSSIETSIDVKSLRDISTYCWISKCHDIDDTIQPP